MNNKKLLILSALLMSSSNLLEARPLTVGYGVWAVNKTGKDIIATICWLGEKTEGVGKEKKTVKRWVLGNNVKINTPLADKKAKKDPKAFYGEGFLPSGSGPRYIFWTMGKETDAKLDWYRTNISYERPNEIVITSGTNFTIKEKGDKEAKSGQAGIPGKHMLQPGLVDPKQPILPEVPSKAKEPEAAKPATKTPPARPTREGRPTKAELKADEAAKAE